MTQDVQEVLDDISKHRTEFKAQEKLFKAYFTLWAEVYVDFNGNKECKDTFFTSLALIKKEAEKNFIDVKKWNTSKLKY